ncbi:flagellar basal body-associated FliL family protein [Henriciella sp. AS95]|uniref:flagellar basal body-associated FliL family protein n=1 Tax=Henriciella sp. AS95 TaxID=3135782 RepID=UPI0031754E03
MAEETAADDKAPEPKSGGNIVNWAILAVVSAACSFAVVFFMAPSVTAESPVCTVATNGTPQATPLATGDQEYVELEELLVTIGNEPATRFVKINTSIVTPKGNGDTIRKAEPMLADAFITYLRSVELSDFETAGFYPRMREQLGRRAELVLGGDVSKGVLITEFLLR